MYSGRSAPSLMRLTADRPTLAHPAAPTPAPSRRGPPSESGPGRLSPLSTPEREGIDAFCAESRPWALREAKRSYRHLPDALREQAVNRAIQELRTRAPRSVDRHTLASELADMLTESLRHVHVGWCLSESGAQVRHDGLDPVAVEAARDDMGDFVDQGLGGLERAVLQLEIGAGRDSRTTRAALRLGPRQYARHRTEGLSKLRHAVAARVIGRACDQHVSSVVAAATGDRAAMDSLASGPARCRSCAREAQGLRGVLNERLAVAPWPLAIKPAGLLVAKVGAAGGALLGGKSVVGGTGLSAAVGSTMGSAGSAAATMLVAATLATGAAAVIEDGASPRERTARHSAAPSVAAPSLAVSTARVAPAATPASTSSTPPKAFRILAAATRRADRRRAAGGMPGSPQGRRRPGTPADPTTPTTPTTVAAAPTPASSTSSPVKQTVDKATGEARKTVEQVTRTLPPEVAKPVDDVLAGAQDTVEQVTEAVDGLLKPKG